MTIKEIDCTDMIPHGWRECERLNWWPSPTVHIEATVEDMGGMGASWAVVIWEGGVFKGQEIMIEADTAAAKNAAIATMKAAWSRRPQ